MKKLLTLFLVFGILFALGCLGLFFRPKQDRTITFFSPAKKHSTTTAPTIIPPIIHPWDTLLNNEENEPIEDAFSTDVPIRILNFGDLMLDRSVKKQIDEYGEDYLFAPLNTTSVKFFETADIISVNLEGPFADTRRDTTKEIAFRFDPALLPMLQRHRFTVFSAANNHSYDMGGEGFKESLENLREAGFLVYGEQYQVTSTALLVHEVSGKKIAFIGVNDTNSPIPLEATKTLIQKAEKEADVTILNAHWGEEYRAVSNSRQQELAHAFIDAGVDVVIGHHPHWVQEMEIYNDRLIFYSLGNFVFDQYFSKATQEGLAVGLALYPNEMVAYLFPLQGKASQVSLMTGAPRRTFLKSFIDRSRLGDYSGSTSSIRIPVFSYGTE